VTAATTLDFARDPAVAADGPGRILTAVFEVLDAAGVPYCLPHGYDQHRLSGDVDLVTSTPPRTVAAVLEDHEFITGARVVRCLSGHVILAAREGDGTPCFLDLDLSADYGVAGRRFYTGAEVLAGRRQWGAAWAPAVPVEFGCRLVRRIAKGELGEQHTRLLEELYRQDPPGCDRQVARFWRADRRKTISAAAGSGDWSAVRANLARLRAELLRRAALRRPLGFVTARLSAVARRLRRAARPDGGLDVILLGTDGAGKSTVIAEVRRALAGAFASSASRSFPPAVLRRALGRPEGPAVLPHEMPPRSYLASAFRAVAYWFVYYTAGYWLSVRPALARSALVFHDRHLLDALVDPRRYRYAGPAALLRMIWRFIPKPDLIILLDAPAEVLQARKRELSVEETARQREAYRALVAERPEGRVVDVDRPLTQVVADVNDLVLGYLNRRVRQRLGLRGRP
jgi:thymidylate kinase